MVQSLKNTFFKQEVLSFPAKSMAGIRLRRSGQTSSLNERMVNTMDDNRKDSGGTVLVSEDVIAKIASTAALEVQGVASVIPKPSNITSFMSRKNSSKSVAILTNDLGTTIDIYLKLQGGIRISEVALQVQENIKEAVQNMTGRVVNKVNVHISDIVLKPATKAE